MSALQSDAVRCARLKAASAELIASVGGIEAAAATLSRGKSGVGRWMNRNEPDCFIPVDEIARLEQLTVRPVMTEMLCRLAGGLFVPHLNPGADEGTAEWLAIRLAKELGEVSGAVAAALADDRRIDAAEARLVLVQLEDLERGAAQLRALMERIAVGDGGHG
jgi:hypothetical protein